LGGNNIYIQCCSEKETCETGWLIAGIWQLKGVRRNADKARCLLCLDEEDVEHILLECKETKHSREKLIHYKLLRINKEGAYRKKKKKMTNRTHIQNIGKYSDIVRNKMV
jgi:hypothetical protein